MKKIIFKTVLASALITLVLSTSISAQPSWLPTPGRTKLLTTSNGLLTNAFVNTAAPYFSSFYAADIVHNYSTAILNPYFGDYGAMVFYGSGHAGGNDNSVMVLQFGKDSSTFHRATNPSPIFGSDNSDTTQYKNSFANALLCVDTAYAEYIVDGQPTSDHTYGTGDVIGPENGGALYGTYIQVLISAGTALGFARYEITHKIDFPTLNGFADGPNPSYSWVRMGKRKFYFGYAPFWTAYVPAQQRIYYESLDTYVPRWYDLNTNTYIDGTGATRTKAYENFNNGTMFYVPQRNLIIFCDRFQGNLRIHYLDVSVSQPSWSSPISLSTPINIAEFWNTGLWCPDNNRILLGDVVNDPNAVYEIAIPPANIDTAKWPVEHVPLAPGDRIGWAGDVQPGSHQKWLYNPKIKAAVYMWRADQYGVDDSVYVYTPRNIFTGITNNAVKNSEVSVYPNPASDLITVVFSNAAEVNAACLTNVLGETVWSQNTIASNKISIDTHNLPNGTYFFSFYTPRGKETKKVCVVR